ncbi:carboxypeptidase regulatory-like domain-containing protein [Anabaena sphaerica FACHB-251]|uniref:Carboxypeptidase regulatory-like domain-containing protein n=1 Tax=Anabaena sphaerica FACHB-251 TaxID=2692883 RepID=A0A927A0I5_9NOST|nr:carboxypeptidase-like regulatory domain-containing protein [Anabaena sphaerica]MBD2293468.1 carboxypeptidase regulatory-like domain-containing protein [Anabaena sphaerica FACHB-251]
MQQHLWHKISICLFAAIPIICQIITIPAQADSPVTPNSETTQSPDKKADNITEFVVFPVGLNVGKRTVKSGFLVRGKEDGAEAVDFAHWLLPYDAVIEALKLNVTTLEDGQLEVKSPGLVTRIDLKKFRTDAELGLVLTIEDLQSIFGVKAEFNINEYAIILDVPWENKSTENLAEVENLIFLEGLPRIKNENINISAIEQKVNISGSDRQLTNYRGELITVGSAFGGSWFLRTNQRDLTDQQTWNISDAQFFRPSNSTDYFVGSQRSFWQSQGDFWGFTYINRQGFIPPQTFGGGLVDARQRLQASAIGRTIAGKAEPGTLARLVQGFGDRVIAEILVDSSGIYRFENIKNNNQFGSNNYRVLLYPQGRLTAQPEIQAASFTNVLGQIPAGTSAFIASAGMKRESSGNGSLLGNFSDFQGGIAGRWGLSESLTVGLGGVYEDSPKALAELFYRPTNIPVQVALFALSGEDGNVNADIRYEPFSSLNLTFNSDRFSQRSQMNWQILPNLSLFALNDSRDATSGGLQMNYSGKNFSTFGRVSFDSKDRIRWNLLQRLGQLELTQRGNEIGTLSEFTYKVSQNKWFDSGNSLLLSYETNSQNRSDKLLNVGWRYRSGERANDGNYLWEFQLGYGLGSQGDGIIASLGTTILPGLSLRGRYQGVSVTSDQSTFSLDLVSSLSLQRGIKPGDRRSEYFRSQGGLLIQPFFDKNNNGKRDSGEEFYTKDAETLVIVNNRAIKSFLPDIRSDRILLRLAPGKYRLDLDPAGFPPDWQATIEALAVDVIPGSYTPVMIPLILSYTVSGVVTDAQGNAVAGARVEAIETTQGIRRFSVTNGAGVYYLETLPQGNYQLEINGKSAGNLTLDAASEPFQELNLQFSAN